MSVSDVSIRLQSTVAFWIEFGKMIHAISEFIRRKVRVSVSTKIQIPDSEWFTLRTGYQDDFLNFYNTIYKRKKIYVPRPFKVSVLREWVKLQTTFGKSNKILYICGKPYAGKQEWRKRKCGARTFVGTDADAFSVSSKT